MSSCSAEEIAEKKRIALEKLNAKKASLKSATTQNKNCSNVTPPHKNTYTAPQPVKPVSIIKTISPTSKVILPNNASINFYHNKNNNNNQSEPPKNNASNNVVENKASSFLNALKQSSTFPQRANARESTHPYHRKAVQSTSHSATKGPTLSCPPTKLAPVFVKTVSCKVYVISRHTFAVQPSGFHAQLIEVFKTIPSKNFDRNTRIWSFALRDYQLVQKKVADLKPDVVIGVIPKIVLHLCQMPPKELDRSCLSNIESTLADKLLPFQQEAVCFAIAQHGRVMICDEMGLGKTYQALAIADFYREDWPLLICTTASTREPWATHIRQLLPKIPCHYIQVLTNTQQYFGDAKVLITSYNMMEKHMSDLLARSFGFVIFDESHMLKNQKAKCTVVADRLSMQAKHVVLLSGTPALSRPLELFTQIQMIDRKFMNFMDFTSRYCDGKQSTFGWDATGQSNLEELNVVLKLKYMVRRTKAEVLPELAEKFRETVVLDPALVWSNDSSKDTLDEVSKNYLASKGKQKEEMLLRLYAETANVKKHAVCSYIKALVKENKKFIVFGHHRIMLDSITECLVKLKVKFVRIDGSTRNDLRAEYVDRFQNKSSCKVAVLSLKACNSGITLTAAELIIFAELDWNPSTLAQAESRAHRIGQEKQVICRYLMATKTADDFIWNMLKNKQDVLNRAGLFCEDLQDAKSTAAPLMSNTLEKFYSPSNRTKQQSAPVKEPISKKINADKNESSNELNTFLKDDDDDDAFMDLVF
ncbi:SWI/SNF-related matrix-associated actin-dependent regulator of chromatin subfamily A-like protein 1 [Teleopsis dalmanni]|uniref:SWI/SNF-related matrix-associated actin-dependent regulator of chromatin subfamily A-like protein 1 n=1 Tax=Teleopsis dalmanni TaxID=139649 RepID=UPI0018CE58AE|nr:SWI/SNF-related matrix-associated actin-dependent regulator of chromatin subfamily A-like protein 1 [Teleopsis dalmanni]